jgi:hypothetical protein
MQEMVRMMSGADELMLCRTGGICRTDALAGGAEWVTGNKQKPWKSDEVFSQAWKNEG